MPSEDINAEAQRRRDIIARLDSMSVQEVIKELYESEIPEPKLFGIEPCSGCPYYKEIE